MNKLVHYVYVSSPHEKWRTACSKKVAPARRHLTENYTCKVCLEYLRARDVVEYMKGDERSENEKLPGHW